MADVGEVLKSVLSTIRVPKPGDRVHKDECALSFASPVSYFPFVESKFLRASGVLHPNFSYSFVLSNETFCLLLAHFDGLTLEIHLFNQQAC